MANAENVGDTSRPFAPPIKVGLMVFKALHNNAGRDSGAGSELGNGSPTEAMCS